MPLSPSQRRYLRGLAHPLKPVVQMGAKGLTEAVIKELDLALKQHELVKVRLGTTDRTQREKQVTQLLDRSESQLVQRIGHIVCVFRRNIEQPRIALPR